MKKLLITSIIIMTISGCATVLSDKQQNVSFDSNEKDVEIYINGSMRCKTPCMTKVDRSRDALLVVAKKQGFEDNTITVSTSVNVMSVVNVVSTVTSTFGVSTDLSSEKIWEYQPNSFYILMEKEPKTTAEIAQRKKENKIRVFVLKNYSEIMADSYGGSKEYMQSLASMSGLSIGKIQNIAGKTNNESAFTNEVIKEIRKK